MRECVWVEGGGGMRGRYSDVFPASSLNVSLISWMFQPAFGYMQIPPSHRVMSRCTKRSASTD